MTTHYAPPPADYAPRQPKSGIGITAMVLGIVALVLSFIPIIAFLSFILGPLAVIFGIVAIVKKNGRGAGIAGLITGSAGFIVVLIGTLLFGAVITAIDDELQEEEAEIEEVEEAQEEQSEAAEAMEEEGDAPEPGADDDGDEGSRSNPLPLGETVSNGTWDVTINDITLNADDQVAAENEFNETAPEGHSYALVNISATYLGDDSEIPLMDIDVAHVAGGGETSAWHDSVVVTPDEFDMARELYEGGTEEGNIALAVPQDDEGAFRVRLGVLTTEDYFYEVP